MDTYNLLKTAMQVSSTRAELISSNIANVNTDGYKAKRVEFENQLQKAIAQNQFNLSQTHEKHLNNSASIHPRIVENEARSVKANGNNVDLEVEMVNQATNGLYYNALTAQLNGRYKMLNYVLSN